MKKRSCTIRKEKDSKGAKKWNLIIDYNTKLIDDGKISEAQQYLWKKVHQQDTDALAIIGFLYFYGVGLKKDEQKGKKILQEAVQKGNVVAADFIKNIE